MKNFILNILFFSCLILFITLIVFQVDDREIIDFLFNRTQKNEVTQARIKRNIVPNTNNSVTIIKFIKPISLNKMSKKDIYDLRKMQVANSIFASKDYKITKEIFERIESYKPWVSINRCKDKNGATIVDGPSRLSKIILNPSLLIAIDFPCVFDGDNPKEWYCINYNGNLYPRSIIYKSDSNEIQVEYTNLPFYAGNCHYRFDGLNARDLGYNYVYLDKSKSTIDLDYVSEENISNQAVKILDYIQLGGACGVKGGCNNIAPYQPKLSFKETKNKNTVYPAVIYLKLWNKKPRSVDDRADINERIIIRSRGNY